MIILFLIFSFIRDFLACSWPQIQQGFLAYVKARVPLFGNLGQGLQDDWDDCVVQVLTNWHCFEFLLCGHLQLYLLSKYYYFPKRLKFILWAYHYHQKILIVLLSFNLNKTS